MMKLPEWENPEVQIVYRILCDTDLEPPPEEHWEGFLARHIVAALNAERLSATERAAMVAEDAGKMFDRPRSDYADGFCHASADIAAAIRSQP